MKTNKQSLNEVRNLMRGSRNSRGAVRAIINGEGEPQPLAKIKVSVLKNAEDIELDKVPTEAQRKHLVSLDAWNNTRINVH